jgi:hypothetical protein
MSDASRPGQNVESDPILTSRIKFWSGGLIPSADKDLERDQGRFDAWC